MPQSRPLSRQAAVPPLPLLAVVLASLVVAAPGAQAAASVEAVIASKWLPARRGYDWSRAGYAGGARPIPVRRGPLFDVTAFGAVPGGKGLQDAAFQAALRAASARPGGGVVWVPAGDYRLASPLAINASRVVLRGAGSARTRLLFTRSLSAVFNASWTVDICSGRLKAPFRVGGGLVSISGRAVPRSERTILANVTADSEPGSRRLWVSSTAGMRVGQMLQLIIDDASTITKGNESEWVNCTVKPPAQAAAAAAGSSFGHPGRPALSLLPVTEQLLDDPVFAAAMGAAAEDDEEEGLTLEQAAAAEAAARGSEGGGEVGAANGNAPVGSLAAWMYGDGRAFSGNAGAVNRNTGRLLFRVLRAGRGVPPGSGRGGRLQPFIEIDRDLVHPVRPSSNWTAQVAVFEPGVIESGIEGLTIAFPTSGKHPGHQLDRGFNGVALWQAYNCWVKDVAVLDSDNGFSVSRSDFVTLREISLGGTRDRSRNGDSLQGHHGINLGPGQSCLVRRVNVTVMFYHDLTVAQGTLLAVYSGVRGADVNIDCHRGAPMANLYSDVDSGLGTRPFKSSGRRDRGAHTARGGTFWNVRSANASAPVTLPRCDFGPLLNFMLPAWTGDTCPTAGWFVGRWGRQMPPDLWLAQVQARQRLFRRARKLR